ncbi:hypothetical protein [Mycoplasmopsis gallinacea]|uniref:Uncharacterized protein n=1 Tax=Mycoplasmopsis gallinacea TaxID=29556 RepID=A0A6H0V656_9BACT|nr:hypothetical protein [Mycoplasmopsis gallinacea]QIW62517.1 hypothetical protein GOQ20_03805 [Mycoplasmopsis gallinacea]
MRITIIPKEEPPFFSEEKLAQILKYTDGDFNPVYDAYKSKCLYEIQSGAKGVSKSFGGGIITIYRLVNDKRFNSVWCRNQYNHIKNTLVPMFKKILDFLAEEHGLDYRDYIAMNNEGLYWNYDDGGKGRAVLFQNFEKTQAFQGLTLIKNDFRFGEVVIDEPIEDPVDSKLSAYDLERLYETQEEKLPLLLMNTIFRNAAPEDFQLKIKFFYNIFTENHFLVKKYHNEAIKFLHDDGTLDNEIIDQVVNQTYLQKENKEFGDELGLIVSMYSKFFVPKNAMSEIQKKQLDNLKKTNKRLWTITVAGVPFNDNRFKVGYYLKNYIYEQDGSLNKKIKVNSINDFYKRVENGELLLVVDGFDPGLSDNASWCRVGLLNDGSIWILNAIEDLKEHPSFGSNTRFIRRLTNETLINIIQQQNEELKKYLPTNQINDFASLLTADNDIVLENLAISAINLDNIIVKQANRRRTRTEKFSIIDRQDFHKWSFDEGIIHVVPQSETKTLLNHLTLQVIPSHEEKRDEKLNPQIYDLINAYEMALSLIYKIAIGIAAEKREVANGFN